MSQSEEIAMKAVALALDRGTTLGVITPPPLSEEQRELFRRELEKMYTGPQDSFSEMLTKAWINKMECT